tara:strand:+ start:287 stop:520 length:234 start_codon:yes stop_codon:yes gene_type:complete
LQYDTDSAITYETTKKRITMNRQKKINFIINERQQSFVNFLEYVNPENEDFIKFLKDEYSKMDDEELNIEFNYYCKK